MNFSTMNTSFFTRSVTVLVLLLSILGLAFRPLDNEIDLRYKFQKGDKLHYDFNTVQVITQTIQGKEQIINQQIRFEYLYHVLAVQDGLFTLEISYEKVYHKMGNSQMGESIYDSEDPNTEIEPMSIGFAGLVGQKFTVLMDDKGRVREVQGLAGMLEGMMSKIEEEFGEELKDQISTSMEAQFTAEKMKRDIESQLAILPTKPVKIGDSWSLTSKLESIIPLELTTTYTLESIKREEAIIKIAGDLETAEHATQQMGAMRIEYNMGGTQDGTMRIRLADGHLLRSDLEQNISGEVSSQGATWPIMLTSTITLMLKM